MNQAVWTEVANAEDNSTANFVPEKEECTAVADDVNLLVGDVSDRTVWMEAADMEGPPKVDVAPEDGGQMSATGGDAASTQSYGHSINKNKGKIAATSLVAGAVIVGGYIWTG